MTVNSKRIYLGKISFQLQQSFILRISGLSWSIIWNFDTSVSTCVEVVLFAVELQNMKVRNLQYYISNSTQNIGLQNASSVLPWPPRILSYTINFLTGRTGQKQLTCLSVWSYKCDKASLLELGQTMCIVCVFTPDFEIVSYQYCLDSLLLI